MRGAPGLGGGLGAQDRVYRLRVDFRGKSRTRITGQSGALRAGGGVMEELGGALSGVGGALQSGSEVGT